MSATLTPRALAVIADSDETGEPIFRTPCSVGSGEVVSQFDAAVAAELPLVSHLAYDSHEICKKFAANVRGRLAAVKGATHG